MIGTNWPRNDEPWVEDALCPETDPEVFFPGKGDSLRPARRTCMACDVRPDCLRYALAHPELEGIWGGTTYRERRAIRAAQEHRDGTLDTEPDHDAA